MPNINNVFLPLLFSVLSSQAFADKVEVTVGGDANVDACMSVGVINNPVEVRAAPSVGAQVLGRLDKSQLVWICSEQADAFGVVYTTEGIDCGVSQPVAERGAYAGRCQSGWIDKAAIDLVAG